MAEFVWLHNPETGALWQSPADYAPIAKRRGWEDSDGPDPDDPDPDLEGDAPEPEPVPADPDGDEQTNFDPALHKAPEVIAYVEQYKDTAPGEAERVLAAERAGRNRKTITGD